MSILGSVFENTVVNRPSSPFNPKGSKVGLLPEFVQVLAILQSKGLSRSILIE